jgi:hypothetical protein
MGTAQIDFTTGGMPLYVVDNGIEARKKLLRRMKNENPNTNRNISSLWNRAREGDTGEFLSTFGVLIKTAAGYSGSTIQGTKILYKHMQRENPESGTALSKLWDSPRNDDEKAFRDSLDVLLKTAEAAGEKLRRRTIMGSEPKPS